MHTLDTQSISFFPQTPLTFRPIQRQSLKRRGVWGMERGWRERRKKGRQLIACLIFFRDFVRVNLPLLPIPTPPTPTPIFTTCTNKLFVLLSILSLALDVCNYCRPTLRYFANKIPLLVQ